MSKVRASSLQAHSSTASQVDQQSPELHVFYTSWAKTLLALVLEERPGQKQGHRLHVHSALTRSPFLSTLLKKSQELSKPLMPCVVAHT